MPEHTHIQAVLFDNKKFNEKKARKWLKEHEFKSTGKIHLSEDRLRFRMAPPDYEKYRYRTQHITKEITLIIGFPVRHSISRMGKIYK